MSKLENLGLSIFGSSGSSGIFKYAPLILKSDFSNRDVPLYLKSTPTGIGVPAYNNWDFSLVSNERINSNSSAHLEYRLTDFSSNRYDSYYSNRGEIPVSYTISHDWKANAIAASEDVLAVATKNWTSFEKYTEEREDNLIACYFSLMPYRFAGGGGGSYTVTYPLYEIQIYWQVGGLCSTTGGTLTVFYQYGEEVQSIDIIIPSSEPPPVEPEDFLTIYATSESVTWSFSGGGGWPQESFGCLEFTTLSTSTVDITVELPPTPPDPSWIGRNGVYIDPALLAPKLSKFLMPGVVDLFEDPDETWFKFSGNTLMLGSEAPDYSDIYIKIGFSELVGTDPNVLYGVSSDNRLYSFGGFIRFDDFVNGLLDRALINSKTSINNESEFLWYIILKDSGKYYSIGLSSYVTYDYSYKDSFPEDVWSLSYSRPESENPYPPKPSTEYYEPIDYRYVNTNGIEVIKVAGFPNCGKVDIYFPKWGAVDSLQNGSNVIWSQNHNLSPGDQIKFTEVLGSGNNLTGLKYALPIEEPEGNRRFSIYTDPACTIPANVSGVTTSSGIRWSAVGNNSWGYSYSLYSPLDKNGYGSSLQLRTFHENVFGDTLLSRALERPRDKPQSDFTGQRSWNNYYPFERFESQEGDVFDVINGNKFGSAVSIKPHKGGYILMVAEEGASESFDLISKHETETEEPRPKNKRVIPSYFPYGRVHFYKILASDKSIQYITTYSPGDNPWAAYEVVNRSERLMDYIRPWENASLSSLELYSYNNIANNYWKGARYLQWGLDYKYDPVAGANLPDQNAHENHYGFLDRLKYADFEIVDNDIFSTLANNVKNADFYNGLNINALKAQVRRVQFNLNAPDVKSSLIYPVEIPSFFIADQSVQKGEYEKFGYTLSLGDELFVGWASKSRTEENIFYYATSGNQIVLKDELKSVGVNGFGSYFVADDGALLTHKSSESGALIQTHLKDRRADQYYEVGALFPVSGAETLDFSGNYDFLNDCLVVRNANDYAGFTLNRSNGQFVNKFRRHSSKTGQDSILKISKGRQASFFDKGPDYDIGSYHTSLQIFNAGSFIDNYLLTLDSHFPEYLPLFIKTIEGSSSGVMPLHSIGHTKLSYNPVEIIDGNDPYGCIIDGNINDGILDGNSPDGFDPCLPNGNSLSLSLQAPIPYANSIDLFVRQIDLYSTGISLFHKSTSLEDSSLDLYMRNNIYVSGLDLFVGSELKLDMPLYLEHTIRDNDYLDGDLSLSLLNFHPNNPPFITTNPYIVDGNNFGDCPVDGNEESSILDGNSTDGFYPCGSPDNYGGLPLFLRSQQSGSSELDLPLYILSPGTGIASSISLTQWGENGSGLAFKGVDFSLNCSGYKGNPASGGMPLFIQRPMETMIPLVVYNQMGNGEIPLYISGAQVFSTGIYLSISGTHTPTGNLRFYMRGDL